MKTLITMTLAAIGFVSAFTLASTVAEAAGPASRITFGDCSHPEPRKGGTFKHPSGGVVSVIGGNSDIVEFRFSGNCVRDYIRDGQGLGSSDIRLGTARDGVQTVLVRMGRNRDLIRVYAFLADGTSVGAFDRIQDGRNFPVKTQSDGSFHVTYGRNWDLAGTYWYNAKKRTWQFGKASRNRNWAIKY
ncbi:MAG: hypothetical protein ABJ251_12355 [Paracoccaceae bacterium]